MYKARLLNNVIDDAETVRKNIKALFHTQSFISSATYEAAHGDSYSFFGRMREAGELISVNFAERDGILKSPDDRVLSFLRAQLFIALVANLEVFLNEILREILLSFPGKIRTEKIESKQAVEAVKVMDLTETLVLKNITSLFYDSPQGYRDKVEQILSAEKDLLDPFWEDFIEMKATRDLGLH